MSRTFRFTTADRLGEEIEQYVFAKYGVIPAKAFPGMVLSVMSKNPLTDAQIARIVEQYGDRAIVPSKRLSGTAEGIGTKGAGQ